MCVRVRAPLWTCAGGGCALPRGGSAAGLICGPPATSAPYFFLSFSFLHLAWKRKDLRGEMNLFPSPRFPRGRQTLMTFLPRGQGRDAKGSGKENGSASLRGKADCRGGKTRRERAAASGDCATARGRLLPVLPPCGERCVTLNRKCFVRGTCLVLGKRFFPRFGEEGGTDNAGHRGYRSVAFTFTGIGRPR